MDIELDTPPSSRPGFLGHRPIRQRLTLFVALQSLALLVLYSATIYQLGRRWEHEEVREDLLARTAMLSRLIHISWDAGLGIGPAMAADDRAQLESSLRAGLEQDRFIDRVTMYAASSLDSTFVPITHVELGRATPTTSSESPAVRASAVHALALGTTVIADPSYGRGPNLYAHAYAPIRDGSGTTHALLEVTISPQQLMRHMNYLTPVLLVALALGGLFALLLASALARSFTRPIDRLAQATEQLAAGEYEIDLPVSSADELGRLTLAFNRMAQALSTQQAEMHSRNRELDLLNQRLRETMSDLESANADLSKSRHFLSTLYQRTPFPVLVTGQDARILLANAAARQLCGWEPGEADDTSLAAIFSPENHAGTRGEIESAVETGRVWKGEFIVRQKGGGDRLVAATVAPVKDDREKTVAIMYIAQDITETRQLQGLLMHMDRLSTRGEMAAEIAHEINNYLTILGGNLEVIPMLVAAGKQDKVERKFVAMKEVLDRIARFSDGLMGYGEAETHRTECELNQLIDSLIGFLKPQNRFDGIHVRLAGSEQLPGLWLDVGQIQQVIVNLLNNAADSIKSCGRADGWITVTTRWDADRDEVICRVEDNGPGIAPEAVAQLFSTRYTTKKKGHGFGLLNCRKIVESHHGRIEAANRHSGGAAFTIAFPLGDTTCQQGTGAIRIAQDA